MPLQCTSLLEFQHISEGGGEVGGQGGQESLNASGTGIIFSAYRSLLPDAYTAIFTYNTAGCSDLGILFLN